MRPDIPIVLAVNDLDFGGAQRTVVEEANELVRRGVPVIVAVTLAGAKRGLAGQLNNQVRVEHFEFRSLFDIAAHVRLARFLRQERPRAVVSNLFFTNTVVRLARVCAPFVRVFVREGNFLTEKSIFVKITDVLLSALTTGVFVNARALVAPVKRVNPFTRVDVLYNGIDKMFFRPSQKREEMRKILNIPHDAFVAIVVGSLTEKKGHTYLFDALKQLPNTSLLVVGDGYMRATLEKRAQKNVQLLGARPDVRDLYAASDTFVLPSLWEGMPNATLEALASGLPVIATNVGGISEIIRDGENGFLVPPRDSAALTEKLQKLMDDKELRARFTKNTSKSVGYLTWQRHADELLNVI